MKSGQLPSDLQALVEDTQANGIKQKDDNMDSDSQNEGDSEPKDMEEQKNNEHVAMEQV